MKSPPVSTSAALVLIALLNDFYFVIPQQQRWNHHASRKISWPNYQMISGGLPRAAAIANLTPAIFFLQ